LRRGGVEPVPHLGDHQHARRGEQRRRAELDRDLLGRHRVDEALHLRPGQHLACLADGFVEPLLEEVVVARRDQSEARRDGVSGALRVGLTPARHPA
jgi:hypothetical protein